MRLFDRTGTLTLALPGEVKITLRYPTDAEWAARARKHPITRQVNGDEMLTAQMDTGAFDLQLVKNCKVDGADIEDQATAKRLISMLDRVVIDEEVSNVTGTQVTIHAKVLNGKPCEYLFRLPSQGSLDEYLSASSVSAARMKKREVKQTTLLEPGGVLFDRNIISVEGYVNGKDGVPLNHKAVVAAVLADLADAKLEPEFVEDPL